MACVALPAPVSALRCGADAATNVYIVCVDGCVVVIEAEVEATGLLSLNQPPRSKDGSVTRSLGPPQSPWRPRLPLHTSSHVAS